MAVAFVLSVLVGIGHWFITSEENPRSYFATYDELKASDLIDKGWLPPFLPRSITEISETHSIDSSRVWATFRYDVRDHSEVERACRLVLKSPAGAKYICPPFEKQTTVLILKVDGTGSLKTEPSDI